MAKKLKEMTAALDAGTYIAPHKATVAQWMDTWQAEYLGAVKSSTISSYEATIRNHIKPCLGSIKLESLTTLFTGLQEGEVCGPQWDCVNLETGTILVDKHL